MPFEYKHPPEEELITYDHSSSGLKGVLNGVENMARKLKNTADEFDGHVSDLRQSSFYKHMKAKQTNIIG